MIAVGIDSVRSPLAAHVMARLGRIGIRHGRIGIRHGRIGIRLDRTISISMVRRAAVRPGAGRDATTAVVTRQNLLPPP